jgi:hypothetical protein
MKFNRENTFPKCVYKVGITSHPDVERRFDIVEDDPGSIMKHFQRKKCMASVWCDNEGQALELESHIFKTIVEKSNTQRFHDWHEPVQLSGITEMRKWNYDEIQYVFQIFDAWKKDKTLLPVTELRETQPA